MTMENLEKTEYKPETKSIYNTTEINEPWYFTRS
jgi:hypothetical protein